MSMIDYVVHRTLRTELPAEPELSPAFQADPAMMSLARPADETAEAVHEIGSHHSCDFDVEIVASSWPQMVTHQLA